MVLRAGGGWAGETVILGSTWMSQHILESVRKTDLESGRYSSILFLPLKHQLRHLTSGK